MSASTASVPERCRPVQRTARLCRETLVCIFILLSHAFAQPSQTSLEIYANAMKQGQVAEQINGLERYLAAGDSGMLRQDALTVLIWDYMRMGSVQHVQQRAAELLKADPGNPVAIAALGEQSEQGQQRSEDEAKERIRNAEAAMSALERLRQPEGMQAGDFAAMRRRVESRLNGMLGLAYVASEDYKLARTPLQQAVAVDPANPQYAYALGLALLNGKDPAESQNGFMYLARAANLTKGTASGQQIAEYARQQYHKAGGNDAGWNGYLAAAVVPEHRESRPVVALNAPPPTAPPSPSPGVTETTMTVVANPTSSAPAARGTANSPANAASNPTPAASVAGSAPSTSATTSANGAHAAQPTMVANANVPSSPAASANADVNASASRKPANTKLTPPPLPPSSIPKPAPTNAAPVPVPESELAVRTPYTPVSLGILIETALLTKENRPVILATLRELISHLRGEDEAAILVFSDQLDFEQDLTANDQLLEQAINELRPRRSKALLTGVAFAAGHLKRIGKNSNRVLLVISDGRGTELKPDAGPLSAQLNGVKVQCIGLDADGADQRAMLERLASYTGGQAGFAHGPEQFRMVALQMTGFLGSTNR